MTTQLRFDFSAAPAPEKPEAFPYNTATDLTAGFVRQFVLCDPRPDRVWIPDDLHADGGTWIDRPFEAGYATSRRWIQDYPGSTCCIPGYRPPVVAEDLSFQAVWIDDLNEDEPVAMLQLVDRDHPHAAELIAAWGAFVEAELLQWSVPIGSRFGAPPLSEWRRTAAEA